MHLKKKNAEKDFTECFPMVQIQEKKPRKKKLKYFNRKKRETIKKENIKKREVLDVFFLNCLKNLSMTISNSSFC